MSSAPPLAVASFVWQPRPAAFVLTVICTATYALRSGVSPLIMTPSEPLDEDLYWEEDPARSIHTPTDFVPFKRCVDVLLGGHAYAPHGQTTGFLVARFAVGTANKAIAVYGDRHWMPDGTLSEPALFRKMPLRWERTAGGPTTWNPVGVPASNPAQRPPSRSAPNLEPVGFRLQTPTQLGPPVGFGALAPHWPVRAEHLKHHAHTWMHDKWYERPLPPDVDAAYFNVAPPDQQIAKLPAQAQLTLVHLHPEIPRLVTVLEPVSPLAVVTRSGAAAQEIGMRCDTLFVDTDRGTCTLTWRASVSLRHPQEDVAVVVNQARSGALNQSSIMDSPATSQTQVTRPGPAHSISFGSPPFSELAPSRKPNVSAKETAPLPLEIEDSITLVPELSPPTEEPTRPSAPASVDMPRASQTRPPDTARSTFVIDEGPKTLDPARMPATSPLQQGLDLPFTAKLGKTTLRLERPRLTEVTPFEIADEVTESVGSQSEPEAPSPPPGPVLPFKRAIADMIPSTEAPAAPAPQVAIGKQTLIGTSRSPQKPVLPFKAPDPSAVPTLEASASQPASIERDGDEWATLAPRDAPRTLAPVLPFAAPSPSPASSFDSGVRPPVPRATKEHGHTLDGRFIRPAASHLPFQSASPPDLQQQASILPLQLPPTQPPSQDELAPNPERRPLIEAGFLSSRPAPAPSIQPATSHPAATPLATDLSKDIGMPAAAQAETKLAKSALSLEQYARIKMELWGGQASLSEVLERHGIDEVEWRIHERRQADALADEGRDGRCDMALALMAAFEASQAEAGSAGLSV